MKFGEVTTLVPKKQLKSIDFLSQKEHKINELHQWSKQFIIMFATWCTIGNDCLELQSFDMFKRGTIFTFLELCEPLSNMSRDWSSRWSFPIVRVISWIWCQTAYCIDVIHYTKCIYFERSNRDVNLVECKMQWWESNSNKELIKNCLGSRIKNFDIRRSISQFSEQHHKLKYVCFSKKYR